MAKKKSILITSAFMLVLFGVTYTLSNKYINFDTMSAILFLVIISLLILKNRKKISVQKVIFPLLYAILWRTKFGLKFMDKFANKYREFIKLIGYCFIGFGFVGMIWISINFIFLLFNLIITPKEASQGVALVLPFTHIPGIGFLSFWHFLISIFVIALVHEFSHGIMSRAHNVPIKSSGFGIFSLILPLFPVAFVEPDENKLKKREDVVQYSIFAAGPMINLILAFIIITAMPYVANPIKLSPFEETITKPVGVSYTQLMSGYPAEEINMAPGTIINGINEKETLDYQSLAAELKDLKPNQTITINTLNGTYILTTKPSLDDPSKGLIGIQNIVNERRVKKEFQKIKTPYYWLKGLIKWLFYLNLFIGLMNLLPLMITDGGRMLKVALDRIFVNKQKANKIWIFIGMIFIFILLSALVTRYGLNLLSVFRIN